MLNAGQTFETIHNQLGQKFLVFAASFSIQLPACLNFLHASHAIDTVIYGDQNDCDESPEHDEYHPRRVAERWRVLVDGLKIKHIGDSSARAKHQSGGNEILNSSSSVGACYPHEKLDVIRYKCDDNGRNDCG